jgi:endonuclease/exonuclease/phosphatase family metal-dependent hydrolase
MNPPSNQIQRTSRLVPTLASLLSPLLLSLFFLEALRLYFAQVYLVVWAALFSEPVDLSGLLAAILMSLSLLAPLTLPLLCRAVSMRRLALASAIGMSLARPLLSAGLPFGVEVVASCVTIALYGLFVSAYLEQYHPAQAPGNLRRCFVSGFALALAYDMAIRALGTSLDLSLWTGWLPIQLLLSVFAILTTYISERSTEHAPDQTELRTQPSWAGVVALCGFGPLLFLEYNLFMHASTVSRWIDVNYDLMAILIPGATVIGLLLPHFEGLHGRLAVATQNLLILAAVACFLWQDGWMSGILILIGQVCVILDLRLMFRFASSHLFPWKTSTVVGIGLGTSLVTVFLLTFVLTLSFAYAYTFDLFRGTEPVAFLIAGVFLPATSSFAAWKLRLADSWPFEASWLERSVAALPIILALIGVALQPMASPQPTEPSSLSLMTYNLHQSFGMDNKLDLEEIATTIQRADPDIVGLQEADAGRVPSLSVDQVLWLSRRLNMNSAYGPSWGSTYGVAILSKYPIVQQKRYLLVSAEQQRSCLETTMDLGEHRVTFFSVHLGLNSQERERQLDEVLAYTARAPGPKVLVGDFNAQPDSQEIGRVLEQFRDSFALAGTGTGYTSPADAPQETIDYIFVWPDITVLSAEVIPSLASDHLPVAARACPSWLCQPE